MNPLTKKKIILYLTLIFFAGGISGAAIAWNSARHQPADRSQGWRGKKSMDDVCDHMRSRLRSRLRLTPDQVARIEPILDQTRKDLKDAHRRTLEQIEQIMRKSDQEIARHLTPEQQEKLKEMEKERRDYNSRRFRGPTPP